MPPEASAMSCPDENAANSSAFQRLRYVYLSILIKRFADNGHQGAASSANEIELEQNK